MARTTISPATRAPHQGVQGASPSSTLMGWLAKLHGIKLTAPSSRHAAPKVPPRELAYMLRNIATLLSSGVSLKKSLATLASERTLKKHAPMLRAIRRKIESGEAFSTALATYPQTFNEVVVCQIRVGEASGTISETLQRIATQLERANQLRAGILKRLSYPAVVLMSGGGVLCFLLTYVVPQFQTTYEQARVPLPLAAAILIRIGQFTVNFAWIFVLAAIGGAVLIHRSRRNPRFALAMDRLLLKLPLVGDWLRDIAMLQFMDVMAVMMQSGFKLVDALAYSSAAVSNHAVRRSVEGLRAAVLRGERLSRELDRQRQFFPPVVSQLVIVGEQTGSMSKSTGQVREHLRQQIERKAEIFVGAIEPILTVGMAIAIGAILLAIYLPMFGMVEVVESTGG